MTGESGVRRRWRNEPNSGITAGELHGGSMRNRILTGCGVALLCLACVFVTMAPWLTLAGAAPAFGIGCYLNRHRSQGEDGDAMQLLRVLLLSGGAMTILAALGTANASMRKVIEFASIFPILPAYALGYLNYLALYTLEIGRAHV